MLSILAEMMTTATRQKPWEPPDYWNNHRNRAQQDREEVAQAQRICRDADIR